ncbi:MAG: hypothetical protein KF850_33645 [Labilithrix sp.]|nr:hypothetical protein [Labilithrix sp.]MBX3217026.1 hypothetical protein [Labilithrix sp.]
MGQDDQRVRRIKQYVLARLREELGNAPRGSQARLAKRLDVSGAHLSNMLSSTPSRQPGEDFRRKVAAHWGVTYAQLEALALGEEPPPSTSEPFSGRTDAMPPNLTASASEYVWMHELPRELRLIVLEQARQHYAFTLTDLPREEWQRILTGLEREALALVAHRTQGDPADEPARAARKRQPRT